MQQSQRSQGGIRVALALIFLLLYLFYWGWTFAVLWGWFVVPVTSWTALSIPQAVGISCVGGLFRNYSPANRAAQKQEENPLLMGFVAGLFKITFCLVTGWVIHAVYL